jgi:hypothetical protein
MTHYLFTLVSSHTTQGMAWAALGLNPRYNHQSIVDDSLLFFTLVSSHTTHGMAWAALGLSLRCNHQNIVDDSLLIYLGEQSHNPWDGLGSSRFEP